MKSFKGAACAVLMALSASNAGAQSDLLKPFRPEGARPAAEPRPDGKPPETAPLKPFKRADDAPKALPVKPKPAAVDAPAPKAVPVKKPAADPSPETAGDTETPRPKPP